MEEESNYWSIYHTSDGTIIVKNGKVYSQEEGPGYSNGAARGNSTIERELSEDQKAVFKKLIQDLIENW